MLHGLVAPQIEQPVLVDIHGLAGGAVTVQSLLEPGFGKFGDPLQPPEGFGQGRIRPTTAILAGNQCLA